MPARKLSVRKTKEVLRLRFEVGLGLRWEICEERYQVRSTILTAQLPVSRWHEQIGDPTLADGILDRLVHNAHRIEMKGNPCGRIGGNRARSRLRYCLKTLGDFHAVRACLQ